MFGYTVKKTDYIKQLQETIINSQREELKMVQEREEHKKTKEDYNKLYSDYNDTINGIEDHYEKQQKDLQERVDSFNKMEDTVKKKRGKELKEFDNAYLQEFINFIQGIQNDMLRGSTKIREIDGIAYRDGASDMCDIIKKKLFALKPKIQKQTDPLTGKNIK